MPEKRYLPGVASSVYEILSRDDSIVKNPKFHVRCNVCGKEKTITRNTLTKYMQSNECMCKGRTLDANVGDVFGIYTIIEAEYRNGHTFVSFKCNVCGHVRTRQRFIFIRDFSHETVCRCKKNVWKGTTLHASSSEMKEMSESKYKSFVGKKSVCGISWICTAKDAIRELLGTTGAGVLFVERLKEFVLILLLIRLEIRFHVNTVSKIIAQTRVAEFSRKQMNSFWINSVMRVRCWENIQGYSAHLCLWSQSHRLQLTARFAS